MFYQNKKYKQYEILLPFSKPKVKTYSYFTSILGILEGNCVTDIWLYNNYLLLWADKRNHRSEYWFDFKYGNEYSQYDFCSFLDKEVIKREEIKTSLKDFIVKNIQASKYIIVGVDVFYLKEWWNSKKKHHLRHELLIYGYNVKSNLIYVADFRDGKNFETFNIPFKEFLKGYNNFYKYIPYYEYGKDIWTLKLRNSSEEISINRIKGLMKDFLYSRDTTVINYMQIDHVEADYVFGLEVFDEINKYLDEMKITGINIPLDIRPFHLIEEFEKVFLLRIDYLKNMFQLKESDEFIELKKIMYQIEEETKNLQFLTLKHNYSIGRDKSMIDYMKRKTLVIKKQVKNALELGLELLENI